MSSTDSSPKMKIIKKRNSSEQVKKAKKKGILNDTKSNSSNSSNSSNVTISTRLKKKSETLKKKTEYLKYQKDSLKKIELERDDTSSIFDEDLLVFIVPGQKKKVKKKTRRERELNEEMEKVQEEMDKILNGTTDIKQRVLMSNLTTNQKAVALLELKHGGTPGSTEYEKTMKRLNSLLSIPFGIYKQPSIDINNSNQSIEDFLLQKVKKIKEKVYGMDNIIEEIVSILAQQITNPNSKGAVIGLEGEPGIGKTRIIKEGVAKALDRYFGVINFGGIKDSSLIDGHDSTYVSSKYGRILQIAIKAKHENFVCYLDEIDKIAESHNDEINGVLMALLDPEQNYQFYDNYFQGVPLDLSKVIFFVSFNDRSKVNKVLLDRIKILKVEIPTIEKKIKISQLHIIPEILEELNLPRDSITINDSVLEYIINNKVEKENGVRNLKNTLNEIIQKINVLRLITNDNTLNLSYFIKNIKLPLELEKDDIDRLIDSKDKEQLSYFS